MKAFGIQDQACHRTVGLRSDENRCKDYFLGSLYNGLRSFAGVPNGVGMSSLAEAREACVIKLSVNCQVEDGHSGKTS